MQREEAIKIIIENQIKDLTKEERENILMDWWVSKDSDLEFQNSPKILKKEISESLKKEIEENDNYSNPIDKKYNPLILLGLYYDYRGVKNDYLENEILRIKEEKTIVVGEVEILEECPCCGYRTLDEKCDWDICKVCFWEDDCTTKLDKISGPNHITLREGQENFLKFGACDEKSLKFVNREGKLKYKK
ncbi:MAG: hypothetical protein ACI85I_002388 [Arenicella sp.]|jgi:hypothetical protein